LAELSRRSAAPLSRRMVPVSGITAASRMTLLSGEVRLPSGWPPSLLLGMLLPPEPVTPPEPLAPPEARAPPVPVVPVVPPSDRLPPAPLVSVVPPLAAAPPVPVAPPDGAPPVPEIRSPPVGLQPSGTERNSAATHTSRSRYLVFIDPPLSLADRDPPSAPLGTGLIARNVPRCQLGRSQARAVQKFIAEALA
jgi:hypothetical protein